MDIDLRLLRHATALAEHKSFAAAARALHLSQPALSRSIQQLEQRIGAILFERRARGVEPTDAGRVLLQRAHELLLVADDFARGVTATRELRQGRVEVGAGPYPAEFLVGPAAGRFASEHPGIAVRVRVDSWDPLIHALRARELAFVVAETSTLAGDADLEVKPLGRHPLFLVARPGHPLFSRPQVTIEDVLAYPLAAPSRIPPRLLRPMIEGRPARRGPLPLAALPAIECASLSVLKGIVAGTDAVTAMPLPAMRAELECKTLAVIHEEPWLHLDYGIVQLRNRTLDPAATKLLDFVAREEAALTAATSQAPGGTRRAQARAGRGARG